jgi:hypothetical protein
MKAKAVESTWNIVPERDDELCSWTTNSVYYMPGAMYGDSSGQGIPEGTGMSIKRIRNPSGNPDGSAAEESEVCENGIFHLTYVIEDMGVAGTDHQPHGHGHSRKSSGSTNTLHIDSLHVINQKRMHAAHVKTRHTVPPGEKEIMFWWLELRELGHALGLDDLYEYELLDIGVIPKDDDSVMGGVTQLSLLRTLDFAFARAVWDVQRESLNLDAGVAQSCELANGREKERG